MALRIFSKRTLRIVGVAAAVLITAGIGLAFVNLYINIKNDEIRGTGLIEVNLVADKPMDAGPLYEAVATEQCIKEIKTEVSAADVDGGSTDSAQPNSAVASAASQTPSAKVESLNNSQEIVEAQESAKSDTLVKSEDKINAKETKANETETNETQVKKEPIIFAEGVPPPDAPLIPAALPKCIAQSPVPEGAEKLGAAGFVALVLNLATNGSVERGEVETTSGYADLDAAALKQVGKTWQFQPCKKAGIDVACKHRIRFRWAPKS